MYWNGGEKNEKKSAHCITVTLDVLKFSRWKDDNKRSISITVTLDVLKFVCDILHSRFRLCITVTLDVLKFHSCCADKAGCGYNSNIRCIEILYLESKKYLQEQYNSNIRCIEICVFCPCGDSDVRITVTLDVLK